MNKLKSKEVKELDDSIQVVLGRADIGTQLLSGVGVLKTAFYCLLEVETHERGESVVDIKSLIMKKGKILLASGLLCSLPSIFMCPTNLGHPQGYYF